MCPLRPAGLTPGPVAPVTGRRRTLAGVGPAATCALMGFQRNGTARSPSFRMVSRTEASGWRGEPDRPPSGGRDALERRDDPVGGEQLREHLGLIRPRDSPPMGREPPADARIAPRSSPRPASGSGRRRRASPGCWRSIPPSRGARRRGAACLAPSTRRASGGVGAGPARGSPLRREPRALPQPEAAARRDLGHVGDQGRPHPGLALERRSTRSRDRRGRDGHEQSKGSRRQARLAPCTGQESARFPGRPPGSDPPLQ